ncbi:SDR family NAD(P)-dependent oxidoreductase [Streptomyces lunalinharesii]|uniref:Type I polyketide synthase n=1 Tax=Streptomyces lunalinharesii TaxID=333384 RepID=A0ABP6E636_9ACTN
MDSADALWRLLIEGRDTVGVVPPDRWSADAVAGVRPKVAAGMRWGCFLERGVGEFDPAAFGVSVAEAAWMAPEHRLLLEVAQEACEHSGIPLEALRGSRTGVYTAMYGVDYALRGLRPPDTLNDYWSMVGVHGTAAGRIAFLLDLRGPAMALDTACSSGLVAVHVACQSLLTRESDLALVGGAQLLSSPETMLTHAGWGLLSPSGQCRAFDAAADGFVRGEGGVAILLKRLADAHRDGDRVLAVLRGSAVNQNGQGTRMTVPSPRGQEAVFRQALRVAGVAAAAVGMVEAHGPGTPAGDPVEFASTSAVYGRGPGRCALGSIKTNIGHLEPVSGLAGLLKAVLSVGRGKVPASLHFAEWNPQIRAEDTRMLLPTRLIDWPVEGGPRIAGVSSYGLGGTNAHVVVEQAPCVRVRSVGRPHGTSMHGSQRKRPTTGGRPYVVVLSAGSRGALRLAAARLAGWLDADGATAQLPDVAHTLAVRRSHAAVRLAVAASSRAELRSTLRAHVSGQEADTTRTGTVAPGVSAGPVWVFSGQGSQWARMGAGLLGRDEAFTDMIRQLEPVVLQESGLVLSKILAAPRVVTGFARVQPVLYAMQVALAAMWRGSGVEPAAVIGHSMGEAAAAVVAGMLSPQDGARVVCRRSRLMGRVAGRGLMASIRLSKAEVEDELAAAGAADVTVAVVNAPSNTVIAGDATQVTTLMERWAATGVKATLVAVDVASHSAQVDPTLEDIRRSLADLRPGPASIPFYSTVQAEPRLPVSANADYWVENVRRTVRFQDAVAAAVHDGHRLFIEVAPHPVLAAPIAETVHEAGQGRPLVLPTLLRGEDEGRVFAQQLAAAFCAGCAIDWTRAYGEGDLVDVPATSWERRSHLVDRPVVRVSGAASADDHPLLGAHVHGLDPGDERHWWQPHLALTALPWLADHTIEGVAVLAGAALCEMACAATREVYDAPAAEVRLSDVEFVRPVPVAAEDRLVATATPDGPGRHRWELASLDGDGNRTVRTTAVLHHGRAPRPEAFDMVEQAAAHSEVVDVSAYYDRMHAGGIVHGAAFRGLAEVRLSNGAQPSAMARLELSDSAFTGTQGVNWHPIQLDCCLQAMAAVWGQVGGGRLIVPVRVGSLSIHDDPFQGRYCLATLTSSDSDQCTGRLRLLDEAGQVLAEADDIVLRRVDKHDPEQHLNDCLLTIRWQPRPLADRAPSPPGHWLLLTETASDTFADQVVSLLLAHGGSVTTATLPPDITTVGDTTAQLLADPELAGVVVLPGSAGSAGPHGLALAEQRVRRLALLVKELARHEATARPRLWAVTRGGQDVRAGDAVDLSHTGIQGLLRVLSYEHGELCPTLIDLGQGTGAAQLVADLLGGARGDDQVAWRAGLRYVARLARSPLQEDEQHHRDCRVGIDRFALRQRRSDDLDSIPFVHRDRQAPGAGEVEVAVAASGSAASGVLPVGDPAGQPVGVDGAGTVTAIGAGVDAAWLGRRVTAMTDGSASHTVLRADHLLPVPDTMDLHAAATLPTAFLTAWYSLRHLANLRPGQSVLIHPAASAVGLAAVAIARSRGATILGTVDTDAEHGHLRSLGIAHVFDPTSSAFAAGVRQATSGHGVDVVLNSRTGPARTASVHLVASGGHFVDLDRSRPHARNHIALPPLARNTSFHNVDLTMLRDSRPSLITQLITELAAALARGEIPTLPYVTHPVTDSAAACQPQEIPGLPCQPVLTWPVDGTVKAIHPPEQVPVVRTDGSYAITGGLGGLGLLVARWLSDNGAASIALCSRSSPTPHAQSVIDELQAAGTRISHVAGDIAEPGLAETLVAQATAAGHPLRGVVHAAGVVEDVTIANFTPQVLEQVWRPKVAGAWRLHEATAGEHVDWWVGFSSITALYGSPGQGPYAAANAALDEFCAWRRSQGLKATSVNWGPWSRYGRGVVLEQRGYDAIAPTEGINALETILRHARHRTGYTPQDLNRWVENYSGSMESAFLTDVLTHQQTTDTHDSTQVVLSQLRDAGGEGARRRLLEQHLAEHIAAILRIPADAVGPTNNLAALGLDSLMSLELRSRIERSLGVSLPRTVIWTSPNIAALAERLQADPQAAWAAADTGTAS